MSDLRKNFSNNFRVDSDMQSQHSFKSLQPSASVRSFNYSPAKGKPANKSGQKRSASPKKSPKKKSPKKKTPTKEEQAKKAKLL
jgi:hypothetical protein